MSTPVTNDIFCASCLRNRPALKAISILEMKFCTDECLARYAGERGGVVVRFGNVAVRYEPETWRIIRSNYDEEAGEDVSTVVADNITDEAYARLMVAELRKDQECGDEAGFCFRVASNIYEIYDEEE